MSTELSDAFDKNTSHPMDAGSRMQGPESTAGSSGPGDDDGDPATGRRRRVMDRPEITPYDAEHDSGPEPDAPIRVVAGNSFGLLADAIGALLETAPDLELVGTMALQAPMLGIDSAVEPDVVLVECLFGAEPCSVLLQRVRDRFPSARALVVCRELDDQSVAELVGAGALGCLTPDCRRDDLVSAIRRVSRGEILFPAAVLMRLLLRQQEPSREPPNATPYSAGRNGSAGQLGGKRPSATGPPVSLARREREVLEVFAKGRSTDEVAADLSITVHTVRTHLKNAMVKLNAHSKLGAVVIALRRGLIELPD